MTQVNSLAIYNSAVLSLFSTGSTKGVLIESGQGVSHTVPVFEGYALPHAVQRLDISGQDVTNKLIDVISTLWIEFDAARSLDRPEHV